MVRPRAAIAAEGRALAKTSVLVFEFINGVQLYVCVKIIYSEEHYP